VIQPLTILTPPDAIAKLLPDFITWIFAIQFSTALYINLLLDAKSKPAFAVFHPELVDRLEISTGKI
jgi:hypothetical protein